MDALKRTNKRPAQGCAGRQTQTRLSILKPDEWPPYNMSLHCASSISNIL